MHFKENGIRRVLISMFAFCLVDKKQIFEHSLSQTHMLRFLSDLSSNNSNTKIKFWSHMWNPFWCWPVNKMFILLLLNIEKETGKLILFLYVFKQ